MMTILTTQVKRRQFKLVQQSDMFLVGCVAKEEVSDDDDDDDSEDDDDDDNDHGNDDDDDDNDDDDAVRYVLGGMRGKRGGCLYY